jgi:hypothetical protein
MLIRKPLDINSSALVIESRAMVTKAERSGDFIQKVCFSPAPSLPITNTLASPRLNISTDCSPGDA